jgi:putative redox protein
MERNDSKPPTTPRPAPAVGPHEVVVTELDRKFLRGIFSEQHSWVSDEPAAFGGTGQGPTPYDLLLMSLGACTSMTVRLYANHNGIPLDDIVVRLTHKHVHEEDAEEAGGEDRRLDVIGMEIELVGNLDDAQRRRLLHIAAHCPVHRTLKGELAIKTRLKGTL